MGIQSGSRSTCCLHHGPGHHVRGRARPHPVDLAGAVRKPAPEVRDRAPRAMTAPRAVDQRLAGDHRAPSRRGPRGARRRCATPGSAASSSRRSACVAVVLRVAQSFDTPATFSFWIDRQGGEAAHDRDLGRRAVDRRRRRLRRRRLAPAGPRRRLPRGAMAPRSCSVPMDRGHRRDAARRQAGEPDRRVRRDPRARRADHAGRVRRHPVRAQRHAQHRASRARCSSARASASIAASIAFVATGNRLVGVDRRRHRGDARRGPGRPPPRPGSASGTRSTRSSPGRVINIGAVGITNFLFLRVLVAEHPAEHAADRSSRCEMPLLSDIPVLGPDPVLRDALRVRRLRSWSIVLTYLLFRTRWGLRLRASGEKPSAAGTVGINVITIRYRALIFAGADRRARRLVPERCRPPAASRWR